MSPHDERTRASECPRACRASMDQLRHRLVIQGDGAGVAFYDRLLANDQEIGAEGLDVCLVAETDEADRAEAYLPADCRDGCYRAWLTAALVILDHLDD